MTRRSRSRSRALSPGRRLAKNLRRDGSTSMPISGACCTRWTERLAGNTIVVFTSDNGGERFSEDLALHRHEAGIARGRNSFPAIVRWPGRIAPGTVSDQVMITMDWMPTLLAAAGTSPDPAYPSDGDDLGANADRPRSPYPRKLFWRYKAGGQRAVREETGSICGSPETSFSSMWCGSARARQSSGLRRTTSSD